MVSDTSHSLILSFFKAGAGIGIRINDGGVDASHPELSSKFSVESSCSEYLPIILDDTHSHGTSCASLAAGSGNNGMCSVGIAPNAIISSCRVIQTEASETEALTPETFDSSYLYTKMENMHVSSNSYGPDTCVLDTTTSPLLGSHGNRRLQQCPFTATNLFGLSPCTATECLSVDWSNPSPSFECEEIIRYHCLSYFELDSIACTSVLDLFVNCLFNSQTLEEAHALAKGTTEGRNGKGIVYVFAAGNAFHYGEDVNYAGHQSSRYVMAVGAVDKSGTHSFYSSGGASLFISAPGGDYDYYFNHVVALAGGTCTDGGSGTSFATPVVAGVVALILEANPELSWRDVQGVLASSSTKIHPEDSSWTRNSAGLHHSNLYGFGLVNASAAVAMSRNWNLLPPESEIFTESGQVDISIPEYPSDPVTSTILVNANNTFQIEFVASYLDLYHSSRGELRITLTSPSGTESVLSPGQRPENSQNSERWKLLSVGFRGEPALGSWTLSVVDQSAGDVSTCVDSLGWSANYTFLTSSTDLVTVNWGCQDLQRQEICSNGAEGIEFFEFFKDTTGLSDPLLANEEGLTPADACCECGGGVAASSVRDTLLSWRLVFYGSYLDAPITPAPGGVPTSPPIQSSSAENIVVSKYLFGFICAAFYLVLL